MINNDYFSIKNSNSKNHNIVLVVLGLFVPWKYLSNNSKESEAIKLIILTLCKDIWCKCYPTLNTHVQYYAINLLQIKKSGLKIRAATEAKTENNQLDLGENMLKNKTLDNIIEDKNLIRDLGFFNNKYL